jgi:hypothetical protein
MRTAASEVPLDALLRAGFGSTALDAIARETGF